MPSKSRRLAKNPCSRGAIRWISGVRPASEFAARSGQQHPSKTIVMWIFIDQARSAREQKIKFRAAARFARAGDAAAVGDDDFAGNREAETGAGFFLIRRAIKTVEHAADAVRGNPLAFVAH